MKKILLFLAAGILFIGCNRDEKGLFEDNADTRLKKALTNAETSFTNAPNGWEMLYFPNETSCGYNILVKFNSNGQAIVAACNSLTTNDKYIQDDNSTWTVKADYGPLLSFDTYNQVMHAWADPQTDGDGYLGDYEFLILNASESSARLKGKKHSAYTQLLPLEKGKDWKQYFDEVNGYRDLLFTGNDGMPMTIVGDGAELKYVYDNGILQDPDSLGSLYFPLIVRPNCVQLYNNGFNGAVHFVLNEQKDKLICTDEGRTDVYIKPGFSPMGYFQFRFNQKKTNWVYLAEGTSSNVNEAFDAINADAQAQGAVITRVAFDRMRTSTDSKDTLTTMRIGYTVDEKLFEGYILLDYTTEANTFSIEAIGYSNSLEPLLNRIAVNAKLGAERLANVFCDTYTVSSRTGSQFNMIHMNLVSTTQTGTTIHIVADNETI